MGYENNDKKQESVYSKRIKAGKRRTYFFDVKATRGKDYYLTITESRKRFNEETYERHKIFLYKEDFNKFIKGLTDAVDFVKTDLMPDVDFDAFSHEGQEPDAEGEIHEAAGLDVKEVARPGFFAPAEPIIADEQIPMTSMGSANLEEVDKW